MTAAETLVSSDTAREHVRLDVLRSTLVGIMREYRTPETLLDAENAVMKIPGFENYEERAATREEAFEMATFDMLINVQANSEIVGIRHMSGKSADENDDFFAHPERTPYVTIFEPPSSDEGRLKRFLVFGSYLTKRYEAAKFQFASAPTDVNKTALQKAKDDLRRFEEYSVYPLFHQFADVTADEHWALDPTKRKTGELNKPNPRKNKIIRDAAKKTAGIFGEDATAIRAAIFSATAGGDLQQIRTFLDGYSGSPALRFALVEVFKTLVSDKTILNDRLRTIWLVEFFKEKMGLSLETAYEINNMPNPDEIPAAITSYLTGEKLVAEMWQQLENEAPDSYERTRAGETLDFTLDVVAEINRQNNKIDVFPTGDEVRTRNAQLRALWNQMFPLAKVETPTAVVLANEQIGATRRAFNFDYQSGNRDNKHSVTVSFLNPYDEDERYFRVQAHESTHAAHKYVLHQAEKNGIIPPGAAEAVDSTVKEICAVLVDFQALKYIRAQNQPEDASVVTSFLEDMQFPDFKTAATFRAQAPYALAQLVARQQMRIVMQEGAYDLDEEEAVAIIAEVDKALSENGNTGFPMTNPRFAPLFNLSDLAPYDGLTYVAGKLQSATSKPSDGTPEPMTVQQAFKERFGDQWISDKTSHDALFVLYDMFIETGFHPSGEPDDVGALVQFVLSRDPKDARDRLLKAGIDVEYLPETD